MIFEYQTKKELRATIDFLRNSNKMLSEDSKLLTKRRDDDCEMISKLIAERKDLEVRLIERDKSIALLNKVIENSTATIDELLEKSNGGN